jgi:predicted nucleic acid-binding protein
MPRTIISDTSCLIILSNIGAIDLLQKVYSSITTTPEIAFEFEDTLPEWIEIKAASNSNYQQILELQIDKGEASAIALALEIPESLVILDDYKARRVGEKLGLLITGTIGVIISAKLEGHIPSIIPVIEMMRKTNFRLSEDVVNEALKKAGELNY